MSTDVGTQVLASLGVLRRPRTRLAQTWVGPD